ncbi:MAG: DUF4147 domain-containing protein [Planctomycetaceae bacterium]|nr:DUF4147 domain-containing protein [Planctomycetaceae bacterium]
MLTPERLRHDALDIWHAGVNAVRSERLIGQVVKHVADTLTVCGHSYSLAQIRQIAVVGAGKGGAGMAAAIEEALGPDLVDGKVLGWVNVPADCVRPLRRIHLHAARPAGVNEPTEAGVVGAERILEIVSQLNSDDLCLVLISGGGSALLPAPAQGVSLADKQAVTKFLMKSGATIGELNCVRKPLSRIKGGGLARAIRAGATQTLIISDVVGDPLDVIASGPTVADTSTPAQALAVLQKFGGKPPIVPQVVFDVLTRAASTGGTPSALSPTLGNHIIGNNAVAVAAAAARATQLGYQVRSRGSENQGEANQVGVELAELCLTLRARSSSDTKPICIVSGGEPVVRLTPGNPPGKGGRNQQLALAALNRLYGEKVEGLAILSGGTDGEDGPTDAAGAIVDADLMARVLAAKLSPHDFLERNDAYHFFEPLGGLIKTGPTHTNVMDLRVALVE